MNKVIRELAERAGFIFWKNEEWKPKGQSIDWICDYDKELEVFAILVKSEWKDLSDKEIEDTINSCNTSNTSTNTSTNISSYTSTYFRAIEERLREKNTIF